MPVLVLPVKVCAGAAAVPVPEITVVPAVTVPDALTLPDDAAMLPVVEVMPVPAVTVVPAATEVPAETSPEAVKFPDDAAMLPAVEVIPVPAVIVVPAVSEPDTDGELFKFTVTVEPDPAVLIFEPPLMFNVPVTGIAVPELVTNEFAALLVVAKSIVPALFVITTVLFADVIFAQTGAAPTPAPINS